jgi:hypothetical protein
MKHYKSNDYEDISYGDKLEVVFKPAIDAFAKWLLKLIFIYLPVALVAAFLLFCIIIYFAM